MHDKLNGTLNKGKNQCGCKCVFERRYLKAVGECVSDLEDHRANEQLHDETQDWQEREAQRADDDNQAQQPSEQKIEYGEQQRNNQETASTTADFEAFEHLGGNPEAGSNDEPTDDNTHGDTVTPSQRIEKAKVFSSDDTPAQTFFVSPGLYERRKRD
jgi:hypothetical protein